MNIYVYNINIINSFNNINGVTKNTKNTIIVSSNSRDNANILITNPLDILLKSKDIKDFVTNINNQNDVLFNLQKLDKGFVKGFVYRIIQGLYIFNKYKSIKIKEKRIIFYTPQLKKADIDNLFSIINYSNLSRNIIN